LLSDVQLARNAQQVVQTIMTGNWDDTTIRRNVARSIEETIRREFENLRVHGLNRVRYARTRHFLTGADMHVSVYALSPDDAHAAMRIQDASARAAIAIRQDQDWLRGRTDAIRQGVEASGNNPAIQRQGAAAGREAIANPSRVGQPSA
jgi:hypothetical protein